MDNEREIADCEWCGTNRYKDIMWESPNGMLFCPGCVTSGNVNRVMVLYLELSACLRQKRRRRGKP